jgi:hypothetical protein
MDNASTISEVSTKYRITSGNMKEQNTDQGKA